MTAVAGRVARVKFSLDCPLCRKAITVEGDRSFFCPECGSRLEIGKQPVHPALLASVAHPMKQQ